jgi:cytochrome c oxidase subunit 4
MSDASVQAAGHHGAGHDGPVHPGPVEYIKVAVFLAVVTAGEVAVYYLSGLKAVLVPVLLVMAVVKFGTVAAYFMHLKFDTHLFRRVLVLGIGLALIVFSVVFVTLTHYH